MLYDAERDRYLVSNVNGSAMTGTKWARTQDNHGFISVLSPDDGRITTLKWIEGGKNKVTLNAPKGLAIANGVLYVADITVVRTFDAVTGVPGEDIAVPGATFLTDLATSSDGKVYLSDSGIPDGSYEPNGTDSVYVIEGHHARAQAKGLQLSRPESIAWTPKGLVVCSFSSNEVYRLDDKGAKQDVTKTPAGGLAGIVPLGDFLLVTSWQTSNIFVGKLGGPFEVALANQKSPTDIGFDTKRARLLVPHFTEDVVDAFTLQ